MTIAEDVQKLNPGAMIDLWLLDGSGIGAGQVRFQGRNDGKIWWQGEDYDAFPISAEGFATTSNQQPQPKIRVSNINGAMSQLCLLHEDMVGAVLYRRRTFGKYLDAINFDAGNPDADPTQEKVERWLVERKSSETFEAVEWELSSPMDFRGVKLPGRQIIANHCPAQFVYRGENCGYTGPPVADQFDFPTDNPALDRCGKRLSSCRMRLWPDGVLNFGGFSAAGLVRI